MPSHRNRQDAKLLGKRSSAREEVPMRSSKRHSHDEFNHGHRSVDRAATAGKATSESTRLENQSTYPTTSASKTQAVTPSSAVNTAFIGSQEEINNKFNKELKKVYSEIDKYSNLLWSAKDEFELFRNSRGCGTRSSARDENKEESQKWQKNTNAQLGYGEITRVSYLVECVICVNLLFAGRFFDFLESLAEC